MKQTSFARWLSKLGVAAMSIGGAASAADVHVMISAGFYRVYSELGPAFRAHERPPLDHDARPVDG